MSNFLKNLLILIFLLAISTSTILANDQSLYPIYQRIKPVFKVNVEKKESKISSIPSKTTVTKTKTERTGQEIYQTHCIACHGSGLAGAPKLGDEKAWTPRLQQGMNVVLQHVISGYKMMPPKGTCVDCNQTEIKAAIDYMTAQVSEPNEK